ncbi:hypothetical protein HYV83_05585 [Candidatus Woesearchaeota archaeon]|nr:hypothetical protein [Candidatus Woesearchaeota archaeon]
MLVLVLSAAFVSAVATTPAFSPAIGARSVNEGQPLNFIVTSTGADAGFGNVNYSVCLIPALPAEQACTGTKSNALSTSPEQITIVSTKVNYSYISPTQMGFNWTPGFTQSGTYKFRFNVTDDDTNANAEDVTVTVVDVPPKLTATATLTLGGDNQERSNPRHDTEDKREINVTGTITVKNDGPEQLNDLKGVVSVASGFTESDLKVNFTLPKTTLAVGESITVPVSVRVPQKLDGVNRALSAVAVNVASVTFTATPAVTAGSVSGATRLDLKAENNLEIKDIKVRFNGESESVDNDDTVDNMKPGQTVEFEIELENRFKEKEDVTIEDIELRVVGNGDLDIDEDEDVGDLGPEDKETIKLSSVIDDEADDGTFDVEITVEGVDELGARHGEKWIVKFEIERKSHEIEIKSLTLSPPTVSCEKEARLSVDIRNSGRRDEDEVFVRVASPELSFGAVSDKLDVDEDDEETVNFNVPVPETVARPANYRVTVDTYFNSDTKSNSDVALLSVQKCASAVEEEQPPVSEQPVEEQPPIVVVQPPVVEEKPAAPQAPAKKSFLETPQYVALLVLAYVVVLGGGAALLLKILRKP